MMGSMLNNYHLLIIGRIIYAVGGDNDGVTQGVIISKWFKEKELAFALGITLTFARLGSVLNSVITPNLYFNNSITFCLFSGLCLLTFSWICGIFIAIIDEKVN